MTWTVPQIKEFQDALLDAFRQKSDLKQMVFFGLSENLDAIVGGSSLREIIFNLTDWADAQGKLDDLLAAAIEANGNNAKLKQFAAKTQAAADGKGNQPQAALRDLPSGDESQADGVRGEYQPEAALRDLPAPPPAISNVAPRPPPSATGSSDRPEIGIDDKDRLRRLLTGVFNDYLDDRAKRSDLLLDAGLSNMWIGNLSLSGPPAEAASSLLNRASTGFPLQEGRRGYTVLGAILNQILERGLVDLADGQYTASVISRYRLIDTARRGVSVSRLLQALMQFVPQFSGEAEAAVRSMVGFDRFLDAVWLDQGAAACRSVCRVETPAEYGTGFLLGPDLLLTNYHVVQQVLDDPSLAPQVVLRFGFKRDQNGGVENGDTYSLAADWRVDDSPNVPSGLDYALMRLADPAGQDAVGSGPRGWLRPVPHRFEHGEDLYIIQHPQFQENKPTEPLKVVLAPNSVDSENADRTRVTYATNTEPGSSGSPCFTRDWELVGLHHSSLNPTSNEGIPLDAIMAQPKVRAAVRT